MSLTKEQEFEVLRWRAYFPYRVVFGALNPETGEFQVFADPTKRRRNNLARKGWLIFQ